MPKKRLGLCIAAVAMTVLGVLTGSLLLIGGGVAATVAGLLAVSHLHIHFSRIGLNNIESTLAILLFLVLMIRIRPNRVTLLAVSGLVVGLAQYLYYGSRVIPLIAVVLLVVCWQKKMIDFKQLAAFGLGPDSAQAFPGDSGLDLVGAGSTLWRYLNQ